MGPIYLWETLGPPAGRGSEPRVLSEWPETDTLWFQVAYTFDAGPNAVIFTLEDMVAEFVAAVRYSFPPAANGDK